MRLASGVIDARHAPSPPRGHYGFGAARDDYRIGEISCAPHPHGAPSEGLYGEAGVALVLAGAVEYRGAAGSAVAGPGAIIFANGGEHFSCKHVDAQDNLRLVLFFGADLLDEIAAASGIDAPRFHAVSLPPSRPAATIAALLHEAARGGEEAAFEVARTALRAASHTPSAALSAADVGRVRDAERYIRAHFAEPCALNTLAALAGVSRFHFARLFKAVTGETPNQYVIHTRLMAAARRLQDTVAPVGVVAFEVGFNDLSHFNASFKAAFGRTPSAWREH